MIFTTLSFMYVWIFHQCSAKPADWRYQSGISSSWPLITCNVQLDLLIPVTSENVDESIKVKLQKKVTSIMVNWCKSWISNLNVQMKVTLADIRFQYHMWKWLKSEWRVLDLVSVGDKISSLGTQDKQICVWAIYFLFFLFFLWSHNANQCCSFWIHTVYTLASE